MSARRDQRGQVSLLVVGFAVVLMLLVAVVVDASAAYLRRTGLDSVADGAALAAAAGIRREQVYTIGLGERAQIDPVVARGYVVQYLSATAAGTQYPGLTWSVDATADRVVVHLAAPLTLPITPPTWERAPVVSSTAASYVLVSD